MNPLLPLTLVPLLLPDWLDPEYLLTSLGNWALWGAAFIVFIECAIFPVLPGDSLLFAVGMFIANDAEIIHFGNLDKPAVLAISILVLVTAAVLGNVVGYWVGKTISPWMFAPRPGVIGRIFSARHLTQTHLFFERYGSKALVLGRFVPFVRTFVTMVAGAAGMSFRTFITWTGIGAVIWAAGVTLLGFFLGRIEFIKANIDAVLVAIVLVSVVPMVIEAWLHRRRAAAEVTEP
ncbi:putative membrane protein [Propionicimonas sp. T2.31MG-18]|uniref:DedA family protein n=1 Tax=Propionicimonas sp. T2.31MG-18 TaxID=3157620 RepID=UPI0035EDF900